MYRHISGLFGVLFTSSEMSLRGGRTLWVVYYHIRCLFGMLLPARPGGDTFWGVLGTEYLLYLSDRRGFDPTSCDSIHLFDPTNPYVPNHL